MAKMSVLSYEVQNGMLVLGVDSNEDGDKVLDLKLNITEGIQEALQKGEKMEGAQLVGFEFSATKLKLMIDSDQDGENLLELEIDLMEAVDEIKDVIVGD